jgi:hypothetical protein
VEATVYSYGHKPLLPEKILSIEINRPGGEFALMATCQRAYGALFDMD